MNADEIKKYAKDYDMVPVSTEIYADMVTPILLLQKIAASKKNYYLLESVEGGKKWARYSFIGYDPIMRIRAEATDEKMSKEKAQAPDPDGDYDDEKPCRYHVKIHERSLDRIIRTDDALKVIRDILSEYRAPKIDGMPPFAGGFVGYFAYAMIAHAEDSLSISRGLSDDYDLMLFDKVIAYDHLKQKIRIIVNVSTGGDIDANLAKAKADTKGVLSLIRDGSLPVSSPAYGDVNFKCSVSESEYADMVNKTREYIYDGDIFQAVISRQFKSEYEGDLIAPYRVLRTTNPSPYMVYMHMDDIELMSTSPETLVRLENGRVITFPVAGSRPRGRDEKEDEELIKDLMSDEKELSEHNMLVDLGRNDLGRISKFGTVEVTKYQMIHKYSKIMHICSQVEADIRDDMDALDAIKAVLPAGTLSGAPKIRACEIIEEIEKVPRGVYGGALGYIDFSGNMDTCIAIRMAVKKGDEVYVQAGGGIVADSVPEREYEESANKAFAAIHAIERAGEVDDGNFS